MRLKQMLVVLALAALEAQAQTVSSWTGSGGGSDWGTAGNWSLGAVPAYGTNVLLSSSGADLTVNYTGGPGNFGLLTMQNSDGFTTRLNVTAPGFSSVVDDVNPKPILLLGTNAELRVSGAGTVRIRSSAGWGLHYVYGRVIVDDGVFEGFNAQIFYIDGTFTVNGGSVWLDSCGGDAPNGVILEQNGRLNVNGGVVTIADNIRIGGGTSTSYSSLWMTNGLLRLAVGGAGPLGRTTSPGPSNIGGRNTPGYAFFSGGIVTNLNWLFVGNDHWNGFGAQWILTGNVQWRQFGGDIAVSNGRGTGFYTNALNASLVTTNNLVFGGYTSGSYDTGNGSGMLLGGTIVATNAAGTAEIRIRRGSVVLSGAEVTADTFVVATNRTANSFTFTGGTLNVRQIAMTNRLAFGGGANPAVLNLRGGNSTASGGCMVSTNGVLKGNGTLTVQPGFICLFQNGAIDPDGTLAVNSFVAQRSLAVAYALGDLVQSDTLDFSGLTAGSVSVSIPLAQPPPTIRWDDRFAVFTATSGTITGFDTAKWSVQVLNADYASTSAKLVNGGDGTIYLTGFGNVKGTRILLR